MKKGQPSKNSDLFVKGPIRAEWLEKAAGFGKACGPVAIRILMYSGMNRDGTFEIKTGKYSDLGVRQTVYKAVDKLVNQGMACVIRNDGRHYRIKLIGTIPAKSKNGQKSKGV
jgi:hypothetical protein